MTDSRRVFDDLKRALAEHLRRVLPADDQRVDHAAHTLAVSWSEVLRREPAALTDGFPVDVSAPVRCAWDRSLAQIGLTGPEALSVLRDVLATRGRVVFPWGGVLYADDRLR